MSDDNTQVPVPAESTGTAAAATIAARVNELGEDVAKLKKQVKGAWITVIVLIVLVVVLGAFTMVPRFLGVRMLGGPGFQGRPGGFQPGQNTAPQNPGGGFQPNPGGAQPAPQGEPVPAPGQ